MNDLFVKALNCKNEEGPPVWLMRQAGRHLKAYRDLRGRYSFLEMCHQPELIAHVTQMPVVRYGVDAAILFSDILVIPEAMGLGLKFEEKIGPIIERPIASMQDVLNLPEIDLSFLEFVKEGIILAKQNLKVPLIGFCGAPFTVASYMIEGGSSKTFKKTKSFMFNEPEAFHLLLQKICDWSTAYLDLQVEAGVDALQVFDSWASTLDHHAFLEFSFAYLKQMTQLKAPMILFCKGSSVFAPLLAQLKTAGIGLDWNCHLPTIRQSVGNGISLQGNLDPDLLYAPLKKIEKEANRLLDEMEGDSGFIFNLGHGVSPDVTEESVEALINTVKQRRKTSCLAQLQF